MKTKLCVYVCVWRRVVLGVPTETLVLPPAVSGSDPVQRGCGLVRMHLLQHPARPVSVRGVHSAGRAGLQLPVHRGETHTQTTPETRCFTLVLFLNLLSSFGPKRMF